MTKVDPEQVRDALAAVRARIASACQESGRDPAAIAILAVTKGFGPDAVEAALAAHLTQIGENYYQEAAGKFARVAWAPGASRHFIGRVQRNKAARIAQLFDIVQTVDDLDSAEVLNRTAAAEGKALDVLVQVNAAGDTRQGVPPGRLSDFVAALSDLSNLRVRGLMAMGPRKAAATALTFARAAECFEEVRVTSPDICILSMGMTDDLELAVRAGSTMLRLGTALFGVRPAKPAPLVR